MFIHFHYVTTCISRGLIKVSERRCGSTLSLVGGLQAIEGISTLRQAHLRPRLSISYTLITSAAHTHLKHISHSDPPDASLLSGGTSHVDVCRCFYAFSGSNFVLFFTIVVSSQESRMIDRTDSSEISMSICR